ncbi:MAG: hypothetical protein M3123_03525, partial [Actinomycetota bacterium]|nr:hypothetical protein [Actinomycetota bacterium]
MPPSRRVLLGAIAGATVGLVLVSAFAAAYNTRATTAGELLSRDGLILSLVVTTLAGALVGAAFA